MTKSNKTITRQRVQEVLKLTLAGAEFPEITQFAAQQGWNVGERQLRRYVEAAYREVAQLSERDAEQLLGRHLMQRRSLFGRAVKAGDLRAALSILQDEAKLQNLYPPTKIAPTTPDGRRPYSPQAMITVEERLPRVVAAQAAGDEAELRLLDQAAPRLPYSAPDTMLPLQTLNVLALIYVTEQQDLAGQFLLGRLLAQQEGESEDTWKALAAAAAYRYRTGKLAWEKFTSELGIDGQLLVRANYQGVLLALCEENILRQAPTLDELEGACGPEEVVCVADLVDGWRQLYREVCR